MQVYFNKFLSIHADKLKKIKLALFDIDGVLTDGKITYTGSEMGWNRSFHTLDGYGIKILRRSGIKVGIISGGNSIGIVERFDKNLEVDYFFYGSEDKLKAWDDIKKDFAPEEMLYMGDEFFDLPLLKRAGFSACPPLSSPEILESVDYITTRLPGEACVREVIDLLRLAQNIVPLTE